MEITINNCNNIDEGKITIVEGALNVKYAINGTGKSTIAKAIAAFALHDEKKMVSLIPFKYISNKDGVPDLQGLEGISSIEIFNEDYIANYVFQPNDILKDSFDIFVKSPNYDIHLNEIEELLKDVNNIFKDKDEIITLINYFEKFINAFGKAKSGYSASGSIGKGIAKGNKIENVPDILREFKPYLVSKQNVKWINWHLEGKQFLEIENQCPFCTSMIEDKMDSIQGISNQFDAKEVEHIKNTLDVFNTLQVCFSDDTNSKISEFTRNATGMTVEQKNYLLEIKTQVMGVLDQLYKLRSIGFHSLKNVEKISKEIEGFKIDLSFYSHLKCEYTEGLVTAINDTLATVLGKAGELQGEIAKQKKVLRTTIEMYSNEINDFLHYAGYKYLVDIVEFNETDYKLILKHKDLDQAINSSKDYLSYGERNAFALVLFMYDALKKDSDMIILDDPISSFDGNKKFAIINMLFMGKRCFRGKTVLLLTHEFNSVIDIIYNFPFKFNPSPKASFLSICNNRLTEKMILKTDILPYSAIAWENIKSDVDNLNKLVYLRRLLEIQNSHGCAWQLISNIFHGRKVPVYHQGDGEQDRPMTKDEITNATTEIQEKYIPDFDFEKEYQKTQNKNLLKRLFMNSDSNYEKLQIYRIFNIKNNSNNVVKKFVNETFHIENDYLFQLNPKEYDTVPQYIIDECEMDFLGIKSEEENLLVVG